MRQLKKLMRKHYSKVAYDKALTALIKQNVEVLHKLKDHALNGDLQGFRELHIQPDWLLLYKVDGDELVLVLVATGSHDDLYK